MIDHVDQRHRIGGKGAVEERQQVRVRLSLLADLFAEVSAIVRDERQPGISLPFCGHLIGVCLDDHGVANAVLDR
jgi:hypothetical protein